MGRRSCKSLTWLPVAKGFEGDKGQDNGLIAFYLSEFLGFYKGDWRLDGSKHIPSVQNLETTVECNET